MVARLVQRGRVARGRLLELGLEALDGLLRVVVHAEAAHKDALHAAGRDLARLAVRAQRLLLEVVVLVGLAAGNAVVERAQPAAHLLAAALGRDAALGALLDEFFLVHLVVEVGALHHCELLGEQPVGLHAASLDEGKDDDAQRLVVLELVEQLLVAIGRGEQRRVDELLGAGD